MKPWRHASMTIPRPSTLWARISTFSSSAVASQELEQPATWFESDGRQRSPSSKRETRSGAPGTFFAIRAFAQTRICRHSAMRFVHGTMRKRSLMAPRFCAISRKQRRPMASIATFVSASRLCGRRGGPTDARWALDVDGPDGEKLKFSCNFLFLCTGYYEYAGGYTPGWPGMERFAGRIVHPQMWPEDLRTTASGSS